MKTKIDVNNKSHLINEIISSLSLIRTANLISNIVSSLIRTISAVMLIISGTIFIIFVETFSFMWFVGVIIMIIVFLSLFEINYGYMVYESIINMTLEFLKNENKN